MNGVERVQGGYEIGAGNTPMVWRQYSFKEKGESTKKGPPSYSSRAELEAFKAFCTDFA